LLSPSLHFMKIKCILKCKFTLIIIWGLYLKKVSCLCKYKWLITLLKWLKIDITINEVSLDVCVDLRFYCFLMSQQIAFRQLVFSHSYDLVQSSLHGLNALPQEASEWDLPADSAMMRIGLIFLGGGHPARDLLSNRSRQAGDSSHIVNFT
jgi:hypothetical protein